MSEMQNGLDGVLAERLRTTAPLLPDPEFAIALRADLITRQREAGEVRYAPIEAPFGRIFVAHRRGVVVSAGAARDAGAFERNVALELGARPVAEAALPERLERALQDHFSGRRRFREVDLSWLRPFQRRVLEKTAEIPRGEVRPYSWIAREIGSPGATRAVGTALGHNPIPFIIPCHRVVRADGSLGEYSGGGPEVKERVLTYEGVPDEVLHAPAPVYRGSRTTHIFCYPTCRHARRIQPQNAVDFASPTKAMAAGYRPCSICRPSEAAVAV
ncbi:MAG: methylated-DNA--[protein]-cysteine S-methyltransferase [Dehalococcoidia bacterium]